jgi:hypothetical protein
MHHHHMTKRHIQTRTTSYIPNETGGTEKADAARREGEGGRGGRRGGAVAGETGLNKASDLGPRNSCQKETISIPTMLIA